MELGMREFRLDFTVEDYKETMEILQGYIDSFQNNIPFRYKEDYTKGHLKRGVE